jgi:hypothetical protein
MSNEAELKHMMTMMQNIMETMQRQQQNMGYVGRPRDVEQTIMMQDDCPKGLVPCNEAEARMMGTTCPDYKTKTLDPMVVDQYGNVCYAPVDIQEWFSNNRAINGKNLVMGLSGGGPPTNIESLIERAAGELLALMDSKGMVESVKQKLLDASMEDSVKPDQRKPLGKICEEDDGSSCKKWSTVIARDLDQTDLSDGLKIATEMHAANATETAGLMSTLRSYTFGGMPQKAEFVFHAYKTPWTNPSETVDLGKDKKNAYASAINPATLAFAGAFAWSRKADRMAERMSGKTNDHKYEERVKKLPALLMKVNNAVGEGLAKVKGYEKLSNLTFDVAWPILMERSIGFNGLLRAAQLVNKLTNVTPERFEKMTPKEQWAAIIREYKHVTRLSLM